MTRPILNAYVLGADPVYLAASVERYYSHVARIVVSFDQDHRSWSGDPVDVERCLAELRAVDVRGKLELHSDAYSDPSRHPMELETAQRQAALDVASVGADWVLQLDGDELIPDPAPFLSALVQADEEGFDGLEFPSRWIYGRDRGGRWLESCNRLWGVAAGYPGSLAVRAGSTLRHARQVDGRVYRVDFRPTSTDPARAKTDPVHRVVAPDHGVLHFSWARTERELREKAVVSGHARDVAWDREIDAWARRLRHPVLTMATTPLRRAGRMGSRPWLRRTELPLEPRRLVGDGP